jgi:hypothetical protein
LVQLLWIELGRAAAVALTPHRGVSTMGIQENADPAMRGRRYKAAARQLTGWTPQAPAPQNVDKFNDSTSTVPKLGH